MKRFFIFAMFLSMGIMGASAQEDRCDVNDDGVVNIADVTYLIDHILGRGHVNVPAKAIDLGLPNGTKWASCNVGATNPEEYGGYYAWGETEEKDVYNEVTYLYATGVDGDGNGWYDDFHDDTGFYGIWQDLGDISGTEYDVAHVKWGGNWCMPTIDDIQELYNNCTCEWTTLNGKNGRKFTSKINGNSIFLPAVGGRWDSGFDNVGSRGTYWSSTQVSYVSDQANFLYFGSNYASWSEFGHRGCGMSVRPVYKKATHEAVDLGLPSGTKWASCNVGASKPEEYGGYYAWGETEEKETYNSSTYKYYQNGSYVSLGSDISGTEYDVAHVKWGGNWCMPTLDDIKELLDNCTSEWTTFNGVNGRRFTGPNGNSIFLPAAGYRSFGYLNLAGSDGDYWSSTQNPDYSTNAYGLYFNSGYADWLNDYRDYGHGVRPVVRN